MNVDPTEALALSERLEQNPTRYVFSAATTIRALVAENERLARAADAGAEFARLSAGRVVVGNTAYVQIWEMFLAEMDAYRATKATP